MKYKLLLLLFFGTSTFVARSQVLMSVLFGDKLNTDALEFGLVAGVNWSTIQPLDQASYASSFNFGIYFNVKLKERSYIHAGTFVLNSMGSGVPAYALGESYDSLLLASEVTRSLDYLSAFVNYSHHFNKKWFVEGGLMGSLLIAANDEFYVELANGDEFAYNNDIDNQYKTIELGGLVGGGYRFFDGKGVSISLRYYHGFTTINKDTSQGKFTNRGFYLTAGIPIGATKPVKE